MLEIHLAENLGFLGGVADASVQLIYVDPPFNTGHTQRHTRIRTEADASGDRVGFQGRRYRTTRVSTAAYADDFDDYIGHLEPRLREARRILAPDGSLFVHLNAREVHYVKVCLDGIFGRENFQNEIIWAYDYGARTKRRWPAKHDTILWYTRDPDRYTFNFDAMDRIPYMAPGLVTPEKAERGKTPTDVWWNTIVPTNGHERTGYPTQKPLAILERIVRIHSNPGDMLMDFYAGSGSFGEAAARNGRRAILADNNPEAARVMAGRLAGFAPRCVGFAPTSGPLTAHSLFG